MQLRLPIFPQSVTLITSNLVVFEKDGIVTYFHCGAPVYAHAKESLRNFRFITAKFVNIKLCKSTDISRAFEVTVGSVRGSVRKLRNDGEDGFFSPEKRYGSSYKLVGETLIEAQKLLDLKKSNSEIGRKLGVSEGAIRYAISVGKLIKKKS